MADADAEKAEKLAAAKKRFEQLKKEQAKKGKKGGAAKKKKDDEAATSKADTEEPAGEGPTTGEPAESTNAVEDDAKADGEAAVKDDDGARPEPERKASESVASKKRSESFRQGTSPAGEATDLYRKQAARIEELEAENKAFKQQQEQSAARLARAEEELESLREGSSEVAELKTKAKDVDRLKDELASAQRQLMQAQQAAKGSNRRMSAASPDVSKELASKTSAMESLELELSNIRNQMLSLQSLLSQRDSSIKNMEERIKASEESTHSYKAELEQLKVSMAFPSDETKAANEDPEALTKRITVLESDLRTANSNLDAAQSKAGNLEQKVEALTKLHRDATTASAAKDHELADLRDQARRRDRPSHVRDASDFELGEDETETGVLQARIRALEAENFDLRRGVWREKRAEMQPGMDDGAPEYEDVDLNNGGASSQHRSSIPRQHSNFQDIIESGISAFTGRPRESGHRGAGVVSPSGRDRAQSMGLLSDDGGFDEEAWRLAQEEEAKRRVERVKEVKRGLDGWRGWRVDLVEARRQGGPRGLGPVFEV